MPGVCWRIITSMTNPRIKPIERTTHRTWDEWLAFMDSIDAKNLNHHAIATKVFEQLQGKVENVGWWAQSVTVAYEQHIGRRIPGQQPDGTFQTSVSRATPLDMQALIQAWTTFAAQDKVVLGIITGQPRVSGTDKRITWRAKAADGSRVVIMSEPKAGGTAAIVVQHTGLQTLELSNDLKATWATVLRRFLEKQSA